MESQRNAGESVTAKSKHLTAYIDMPTEEMQKAYCNAP
jgi:hypothetical protein